MGKWTLTVEVTDSGPIKADKIFGTVIKTINTQPHNIAEKPNIDN